ncbi:hypothetical protein [Streptomyces sp. NPDC046862]|uniref:hypothetical protein n=1 Tax=Streptomyces sp. NPDC046862 TaxID=3154603 RepID=UPI003456D4A2
MSRYVSYVGQQRDASAAGNEVVLECEVLECAVLMSGEVPLRGLLVSGVRYADESGP